MNGTDESKTIGISLWEPDVVVLFDWLMSVDLEAVPIRDRSQKQALMDLLTALETQTLAPHASEEQIKLARERVARDLGW